ncbi:MAG: threonine--tRNA ligase, partial [Ignavibacteriae bacterium]|nr:threonine--tRNA ligase [Ignavibacteriota bacterium]
GDPALWEQAEASLRSGLESNGLKYAIKEKDGAFYGPKIDIQIKDAIGREWQVATIQLDFVMLPERFDLEYVAEDGTRKRPVAIHRAIFGSFERFIGIITEHFAGAFHVWLSPVQVAVMPITDAQREYAQSVYDALKANGLRVEMDDRSEKINFKIRDWEMKKVPFMLVVGQKEKENTTVSVRRHKLGDVGVMGLAEIAEKIKQEYLTKSLPQ